MYIHGYILGFSRMKDKEEAFYVYKEKYMEKKKNDV